jgi:hypothetical protein
LILLDDCAKWRAFNGDHLLIVHWGLPLSHPGG